MAFLEHQYGVWHRIKPFVKIVGVITAIVVGIGSFYVATLFMPGSSGGGTVRFEAGPEVIAKYDRSVELEDRFRELADVRAVGPHELALLEEAVSLQRGYLEALGGHDREAADRLRMLQTLLQDYLAAALLEESRAFEVQAVRAETDHNEDEARRLVGRALTLQQRINEEFPLSRHNNVGRLTQLDRRLKELEARPLHALTLDAEKRANAALEAGDWDTARREFRQAIDAQATLNREYSHLRIASITRLEQLEVQLASLQSSYLRDQVEALVERGKAKEESEGDYVEAAVDFQEAARVQRRLNERYPRSRFASTQRLEQLEQMQRVALSREVADEIIAGVAELDQMLRSRQTWQAQQNVGPLYRKAERFLDNHPRSPLIDSSVVVKLQYLNLLQAELGPLQDAIYSQLVPLSGGSTAQMFSMEVPQSLYQAVMNANPSRNRDDLLPVDSLTWQEAADFCQRIGWLLARPVRLPNREEFRSAVGNLRYVDLNAIAWHAGNSAGVVRPVGTTTADSSGFHDLLGNIAEWLDDGEPAATAEGWVAGGSIQSTTDELLEVPFQRMSRRERNRLVGFRFVVEVEEG